MPVIVLVFGLLLAAVITWDDLRIADAAIEEDSLHHMESLGNTVSGKLEYDFQNGDTKAALWDTLLLGTESHLNRSIAYDNYDDVIAATNNARENTPGDSPMPEMSDLPTVARETNAAQIRLSQDGNTYAGAFPFKLGALSGELQPSRTGVLYVEIDLHAQRMARLRDTIQHIALISVFILPFLLAMWLYLDRAIAHRASRLITVTRKMAGGDLTARASLRGSDELAQLGESFNFMADAIQDQTETIISSEEKFRTLFEQSKDGVIISSMEGKIVDANPAAIDIFGYKSRGKMLKIAAKELYVDATDRQKLLEIMQQQGFVKSYSVKMKTLQGKVLTIVTTVVPQLDDAGNIVALRSILRDMTEFQQMEEQLLQSQKLESIGQLAGGVAHDFNNYLTAIMGYIDLAMSELPADSSAREELVESRNSSERAANLARQLLIFSRREAINPRPVNLNTVISELLKMLERLIGEQFRLTTELADDPWTVNADAAQIEQVIMNLTVNARDAMTGSGEITISTANRYIDPEYAITHPDSRVGEFFCITVKDTGSGIGAETISHIFEPFFSTKGAAKGTGLGLSVVYGIMKQHDGWIEVDSQPGEGSTFTVFLPAMPFQGSLSDIKHTEIERFKGHGEKVLLVEDDDSIRNLSKRMLSQNGYSVTTAASAEEAVRISEESGDVFQLVFSDVILPEESGISLVERLQARQPDIKILLASGYSDTNDQEMITGRGYPFMSKPYSLEELLKKIRDILSPA